MNQTNPEQIKCPGSATPFQQETFSLSRFKALAILGYSLLPGIAQEGHSEAFTTNSAGTTSSIPVVSLATNAFNSKPALSGQASLENFCQWILRVEELVKVQGIATTSNPFKLTNPEILTAQNTIAEFAGALLECSKKLSDALKTDPKAPTVAFALTKELETLTKNDPVTYSGPSLELVIRDSGLRKVPDERRFTRACMALAEALERINSFEIKELNNVNRAGLTSLNQDLGRALTSLRSSFTKPTI